VTLAEAERRIAYLEEVLRCLGCEWVLSYVDAKAKVGEG
jgi:hypothetical protein